MIRRTPLYERHIASGARMVNFAGWEMPVQYAGILDEHRSVRQGCGIFDISHMGEFLVRGDQAPQWLDSMLTNCVATLELGHAEYSLMLNERGGIIDDLMLYRTGTEEFLLIVNAAKIEEDFSWLQAHLGDSLNRDTSRLELINCSADYAAFAVQGPESPTVFAKVLPFAWEERRNHIAPLTISKEPAAPSQFDQSARAFIATTGYTGEQGFEIFVPAREAERYWDLFVAADAKPCGLGARDILRLEMCYPLNGSDLSPDLTPLEAGLSPFVDFDKENFVGRDALLKQKADGLERKLSAIRVQEKSPPIRPHYALVAHGEVVAETTSGALSPSLGCGIALGYLPFPLAKPGQDLEIEVRGKRYSACVVKKPFYHP
ncbi:MAG TPA: glycine cleavage system aminomethyltransferase GcvT, partial [Terrimicrobiaceae bacterium]